MFEQFKNFKLSYAGVIRAHITFNLVDVANVLLKIIRIY